MLVALKLGRNAIGIELVPKYCDMIKKRLNLEELAQKKAIDFEFKLIE